MTPERLTDRKGATMTDDGPLLTGSQVKALNRVLLMYFGAGFFFGAVLISAVWLFAALGGEG